MEHDELIDAVQELRLEHALHLDEHLFLRRIMLLLLRLLTRRKAHGRCAVTQMLRPRIRRHDDDRVVEIHGAALSIRQTTIVEHLQQDVEHIAVCLLDLIEKHDGIRFAAHRVRELASLLIADIARRCAHETRHGILLHVLRHIEADDGLLAAEQRLGQRPRELRLAHTRRAEE